MDKRERLPVGMAHRMFEVDLLHLALMAFSFGITKRVGQMDLENEEEVRPADTSEVE